MRKWADPSFPGCRVKQSLMKGRTDVPKSVAEKHPEKVIPPNGRLPDAAKGAEHIRIIFNRMGFNDREIVALSGAHSLGRCHPERSGYEV